MKIYLLSLFCFVSCAFSESIIIGIAGGTASGKTTLAHKIQETFQKEVVVISQDSYFKHLPHLSLEERMHLNWDCPEAVDFDLLQKHLTLLKQGESIELPVRNFCTFSRENFTKKVDSASIIVIEGILVFANQEVKDLCDIKIFIEADADIRLLRRINRDIEERGANLQDISSQYIKTIKPMHDLFVEPTKVYADIIIPSRRESSISFDLVQSIIMQTLQKQTSSIAHSAL